MSFYSLEAAKTAEAPSHKVTASHEEREASDSIVITLQEVMAYLIETKARDDIIDKLQKVTALLD